MVSSYTLIVLTILGCLHSVFCEDSVAAEDSVPSTYTQFQYSDSHSHNDYPATYYEVKPQSTKYGAPPAPSYGTPAPAYGVPSATYGTPKPEYGPPPAPTYTYDHKPMRGYGLDSESPFVQKRLFNTAVALTVPLFSFVLPQRSSSVSGGLDLANQVQIFF